MLCRLWVRIPHHILDKHFSHMYVVKIVMFVWKDENKLKRGRGLPIFFKKKRCTIDAYSWSCWNGPTTAARAPPKLKLPATARVKTNTSSDFIAWNKEFQFTRALIGWFLCVKRMVYTDNARYFIGVPSPYDLPPVCLLWFSWIAS